MPAFHVHQEEGPILACLHGTSRPTGADSIALALVADRLVALGAGRADVAMSANDIGYAVGGPLIAGFATWVADRCRDTGARCALVCGPAARLVVDSIALLRPEAATDRLHIVAGEVGEHLQRGAIGALLEPDGTAGAADDHGARSGDRTTDGPVLVVDLGWTGRPHRAVRRAARDGRARRGGASVPTSQDRPPVQVLRGERRQAIDRATWLGRPAPAELVDVASRLLVDDGDGELAAVTDGILCFVADFAARQPVPALTCSPATAEPAMCLGRAPTDGEERLLARLAPGIDPARDQPARPFLARSSSSHGDRRPIRRLFRRGRRAS